LSGIDLRVLVDKDGINDLNNYWLSY
jgi:hypothetical protein